MKSKLILLALMLALVLTACSSAPEYAESPLIGTTAPDFTLENALGGQTSLSEFEGTPVLLFFHMAAG